MPSIAPALARHLVEAVMAVMALEFLVLSWRRRARRGAMLTLALALAPGLSLTLALRLAMGGAAFLWIGLCLVFSLPFHIADLARRGLLRGKEKAGDP